MSKFKNEKLIGLIIIGLMDFPFSFFEMVKIIVSEEDMLTTSIFSFPSMFSIGMATSNQLTDYSLEHRNIGYIFQYSITRKKKSYMPFYHLAAAPDNKRTKG